MKIQKYLTLLGLSEREARVYQALLNLGPSTITKIVNETSIPSSKIYDILERLEHKGLVSHILIKGKKEFHPSDPKKLFDLIKEKEDLINEILPELDDLYKSTSEKIEAEIYKGKEGLKTILQDTLNSKEVYNLGGSGLGETVLPYSVYHYYDKLNKKRINYKILAVNTELAKKQFSKLTKYKNVKIRFLPKSIKNLMSILVYGDKVAIIPITPMIESKPIIILIKSKETADSYREYFKWIWEITKK